MKRASGLLATLTLAALGTAGCGSTSNSGSQTGKDTAKGEPLATVATRPQEHTVDAHRPTDVLQIVHALLDEDQKIRTATARGFLAAMTTDLSGKAPSIYESFLTEAAKQNSENQKRIMAAFFRTADQDTLGRLHNIAVDAASRMVLRSQAIVLIGMNADLKSFDVLSNLAITDSDPLVRESAKDAIEMMTAAMSADRQRPEAAVEDVAPHSDARKGQVAAELSFEGITSGMPVQLGLEDGTSVEGLFVTADSRAVSTLRGSVKEKTSRDRIRTLRFPSLDRMQVRNTMRDILHTVFSEQTPALVRLKNGTQLKGLILRDMSAMSGALDETSTIKINSNGKIVTVLRGAVLSIDFLE